MSIKSPCVWELLSSDKLSIYDYWCSLSQFPLLQSIAKRVYRCTPSSSASERNVSSHGFIHSRLRNRLEPDRVEKLVHVYFNAGNIQDADMEMYSDLDDLLRLIDNDDEDDNTRDNRDADFVYE
ncbi:hypothetical protein PR003_g23817 [Phytophthora rubi]|uniref:HAT C-terminal dimerisation domain-containing protein n=1 Tax=Phytophthora rubi TaxID=129364 RepID=A0A6A3IW84_9STRA|nr:hypothetical protein PR002_g23189 [Phytophthora rubi]KAE8986082.1 hypothetical protein PR001_g22696 [Phytophthora rubi]KAE9296194.1 hypothetical protein PR003_g23817 [Phytophthora rubi]